MSYVFIVLMVLGLVLALAVPWLRKERAPRDPHAQPTSAPPRASSPPSASAGDPPPGSEADRNRKGKP